MNIKALIKTFTPHKDLLFIPLLVIAFAVVGGALAGAAIGINYILVYLFGTHIANIIQFWLYGCMIFWWFIGEPLYDRYKRIKRQLEKEG